jgi:hypothetical protein
MTHSQIQQGTVGSSQTMLTGSERDEIERVLAQVRKIVATLPLSSQDRIDVDGNAATVRAQLGTSKPNRTTIRESIMTIAQTLKPFAEAAGLAAALTKLAMTLTA